MQIEFDFELGDVIRTKRGEIGTVVAVSATHGRSRLHFKSYRIEMDDGGQCWVPEHRIEDVVAA